MRKWLIFAGLSIIYLSLVSSDSLSQTIHADTFLANKYFYLAGINENESRIDSAIFYAEKAQLLFSKYFGINSTKNADALHLLGRISLIAGLNDDAMGYNLKALQIRKEILGTKHVDVARSYFNLGLSYENKVAFDKALECYFEALHIHEEILGQKHLNVAACYQNIGFVFHYLSEYNKSLDYHLKAIQIKEEILGKNDPGLIGNYLDAGIVLCKKGEYDKSLEYTFKALQISRNVPGENDPYIATAYNNIGTIYNEKGEYDKSLEYTIKALQIDKKVHGEKHPDVGMDLNNIGNGYWYKGEYDKALEYYFMALQLRREIYGERHLNVASCYINIGNAMQGKGEYNKALEYYLTGLQIRREILGENHVDVASCYTNIGVVFLEKNEYEKALEYNFKAFKIDKEILGERHPGVAADYINIGHAYWLNGEYDKALQYNYEALQINRGILGEKHPVVAKSLADIGVIYRVKGEEDKALEYCLKALQIRKESLGEKHPDVAQSYYDIGFIYKDKAEYEKALKYYQKCIASCLQSFNDTSATYYTPVIRNVLVWKFLIEALHAKAKIISDNRKNLSGLSDNERKEIALRHYQSCDTLIDVIRRGISTQSDKIALGEKASQVYMDAIDFLVPPQTENETGSQKSISYQDAVHAFYFTERNKSSVLLEALSGQEAQRFAGIPDSLLLQEHSLKIDIAFYTKKLAEPEKIDSGKLILFQSKLFRSNRSYDSLIMIFEKQFPEYHNLKYNNKPSSVKDIQDRLDNKTALISYFTGDSLTTIFTLTKYKLDVIKVHNMADLNDSIVKFRYGLTNISPRMKKDYRNLGHMFYEQMFPEKITADRKIKNLIIIPDGKLAQLPYESLLTENFTGDIDAYKEYPYLVKRFNIGYSYSANLYCLTFSKEPSPEIEITRLYDWLAFAPVFDDTEGHNRIMTSHELQQELSWIKSDSLLIHRSMIDGNYISPLPATKTEVEAIFKIYDSKNLKAKVLLNNNANEKSIKSDELGQYKVLHFASHGFVNSEKPELSGILTAQDTAGNEDGFLYSGEIYNLKLNADLVVLSACETGLGKIQKGEGIIGLTRALLYAGSKNIIVSLWQVADQSTSDLMVSFYYHYLGKKGEKTYPEALRTAKLKMIKGGNYAHPMYWSPFILIGK